MSRSALEKQMRQQMQRAQQQQFELRQQQFQRQQQLRQQQQAMAYAAVYQQQTGMMYDPYTLAAYQQQAAYYDPYGMYASAVAVAAPAADIAGVVPDDDEEYDEEDPTKKKNAVPMHGNSSNYNINTLLFDNIMTSDYFRALFQLRTYHEVISEIERVVKHVEPWQTGTSRFPSSAFCLLVKFMTMKLTFKQLNGLLTYGTCEYVRAIGLLYLRYVCPPADLWKWIEPYIEDDQEIAPASDKSQKMTIGFFAVKLITDMQYYGTTLPRIPVPIERKLKVYLLLVEEKKKRRQQNLRQLERFTVGASVEAIYGDDANEPAWYPAVIDSIAEEVEAEGDREDNSKPRRIGIRSSKNVKRHRFWVTFPEYGNSEFVDLGDMRLPSIASTAAAEGSTDEGKDNISSNDSERTSSKNKEDGEKKIFDRESSLSIDRRSHHDDKNRRHQNDRSRSRSRDKYSRSYRHDSRDRYSNRDRQESSSNRYSRQSRSRSPSERNNKMSSHEATEDLLKKVMEAERNASTAVGKNYAHRPASYKGSLSMKLDTYTSRKRSPPRGGGSSGGGSGGGGKSRRSRTPSPPPASHGGGGPMDRMKMLKERYGDASALSK